MGARTYQPGEKIIAEGTFGTETYFIESGSVSILKETGQSNPIVLATLADGDVFGEMYLFGPAGFRSASAVANTPVTVHIADRVEMETDLANTPHRIKTLLHTINRRLEKTSQEFSLAKMQLRRQLFTARTLIGLLILTNALCIWLLLLSRSN
jgi:CRP-like cAMP-binding protein